MGFGQGLSGLNAAAQNLDVIGNNIANSGTVGFKAGTATFADVYANSRVGIGTSVASINQRFTVGTVASTGNQFDMAIDGAKGLFRVVDPSGNVLYTRNGQFFADKDNNIVNAQGQRLTGYAPGGTNMVPVQVPVGNIPPLASSNLTTKANLDANSPVIGFTPAVDGKITLTATAAAGNTAVTGTYTFTRLDPADPDSAIVWNGTPPPDGFYSTGPGPTLIEVTGGNGTTDVDLDDAALAAVGAANYAPEKYVPIAFDPANPDSYNPSHSLRINVYDSLGNSHELTQYYVKLRGDAATKESVWEVHYRLDGKPLDAPAGSMQEMRFDAAGRLESPEVPVDLVFGNPGGAASPAGPLNISLNYSGTTQFGGPFATNFTQNGFPTGEYASMSIGTDGSIQARYTNGETRSMGTLVLADFNNLQGLQPVGGNAWIETSASGQPTYGRPGENGMATIRGQAVEESNVDMSVELVNMIIAQRTYQANAQTIKTQDQILQTLITMR
ncbi:MAG: flagellar hook-basal body complex protein [Burkholderiaceae bacterium]|nr:flagellar hook-basal body complex protein [Burkholderiaceae bacterium]